MEKKQTATAKLLSRFRKFRYYLVLEGIAVGIAAGLVTVLFRIVLEQADNIRQQIGAYLAQFTWAILIWLVVLCGLAALVTLLLRWEPLIGGSGIPQVEGELRGGISQRWWRVLLAKFTGGVLAIGAGPVSYTHLSCHPDHQIMP